MSVKEFMENIKIPRLSKTKWLLLAIIGVIILVVLIKPSWPRSFIKQFQTEQKDLDKKLEKAIDSVNRVRASEIEKLEFDLTKKDIELQEVSKKLQRANQINIYNEKKLNDYRFKSYDGRFRIFAGLIAETDTIPER